MLYWIYDYPLGEMWALFAFVFAFTTIGAVLLVRRYLYERIHNDDAADETVRFAFSNFFVLYGLLVGLLAVASYQNLSTVSDINAKEASGLSALYRDLRGYPEPTRSRLQSQLRIYTQYVIDTSGKESRTSRSEGSHRMAKFMDELVAFRPTQMSENIIHAETLRQANVFLEYRQARIANLGIGIEPVLWWVVGLGAVISIALIAMIKLNVFVHLLLSSILSIYLGSVIFVIAAMDNPYRGDVRISPEAFQAVFDTLMEPNQRMVESMAILKDTTAELGPPRLEGKSPMSEWGAVDSLYFGDTMMNDFFVTVDDVVKKMERPGGTATIFVKHGTNFIRIATNVRKDDGTRATGTRLDPSGPAMEAILKDVAFYGEADILGAPYITGYEPLRDAAGQIIGIYYVGYPQDVLE